MKRIKAVSITNLETFETFTLFHSAEGKNIIESQIFDLVIKTRETIKIGPTIGDPIF